MNDTSSPGVLLRLLRQQSKLSQAKLAAKAGVDPATISRLELDKSPGDLATWKLLATALDVDVSQFVISSESRVELDAAYPSLDLFLSEQDATPEEREFLSGQRFKGGDPGQSWWAEQLAAYRRQQRILELERAAGRTDRRPNLAADLEHDRDDVLPLSRKR